MWRLEDKFQGLVLTFYLYLVLEVLLGSMVNTLSVHTCGYATVWVPLGDFKVFFFFSDFFSHSNNDAVNTFECASLTHYLVFLGQDNRWLEKGNCDLTVRRAHSLFRAISKADTMMTLYRGH